MKAEVWERDEGHCGLCGEPADPDDWNADHILPRALGGPTIVDNLRVAHPRCNRTRTDPRFMSDEQITEAAREWTATELDLDKVSSLEEILSLLERLVG